MLSQVGTRLRGLFQRSSSSAENGGTTSLGQETKDSPPSRESGRLYSTLMSYHQLEWLSIFDTSLKMAILRKALSDGYIIHETLAWDGSTPNKNSIGTCACFYQVAVGSIEHSMNWSHWTDALSTTLVVRLSCPRHRRALISYIPKDALTLSSPVQYMLECVSRATFEVRETENQG